jgi:hypothetical protein
MPVGLVIAVVVIGLASIALLAWQMGQPQPIDLLKLIDPTRDAISGEWKIAGGVLRSPDAPYAILALPHAVRAAYMLEIEIRQLSGSRLAIGLVRDGEQFPVVLNTASIGDAATENADSEQSRALAAKLGFQGGPPRTYTAIVRPNGVLVAYEDRIELAIPAGEPLPATGDWRTANPETLFIGAHHSEYEFRRITLTPLSP